MILRFPDTCVRRIETTGFTVLVEPSAHPDPVPHDAAAVPGGLPPDHDAVAELAHDNGRDRGRRHGVADQPPVGVDDAEARREAERNRGAHAADRVDRAHGVDARAPGQRLERGEPARHLVREDPVPIDAIRHRPDVVRRELPREAHVAGAVACDLRQGRHGGSRPVGRVQALEEARVLHVVPGAGVPVVVVATDVEQAGLERSVLEGCGHQIREPVADVTAGARVRRRAAVDGAERVHELVRGHDHTHVVSVTRAARVEIDDGHSREAPPPFVRLAADAPAPGLARWAVEVDEVDLLRLAEAVLGPEQLADPRVGPADVGDGRGQRHAREVEGAERAVTAEGVQVEARCARRVLAPPPGVDGGDVADQSRCPLGEAVGGAGGGGVDDVHAEGGCRIAAVEGRQVVSAPGQRCRGVRPARRDHTHEESEREDEPLHRMKPSAHRRRRVSARSVQDRRSASKCPAIASL